MVSLLVLPSLYLSISTLIENRVGDDGMPAILKYRPSDLYLTDRKPTMTILQKIPAPLSTFTDKALPLSSLSPTTSLLSNYKGSLWSNLAWWPLSAPSIPMPPLSPTTNHHHAPLLFTLSPLSWDIISFYTWDYSCMGQSQHVFCKKMHLDVLCNARASC